MTESSIIGFYSIWPVLVLVALAMAVASGRMFRMLDPAPGHAQHRDVTIDGLRSLLALAVFFHHMSIRRAAVVTGVVALPPSHFFSYLGSLGVSLFFMITGYLFWGKLLDSQGRVNWTRLYVGRLFRIVPLYWALMAIYFAMVLMRANDNLWHAIVAATPQMVKWMALGAYPLPAPVLGDVRIMSLVGMTWTLTYEWAFYASLPILALVARFKWSIAAVIACLLGVLITRFHLQDPIGYFVAFFLAGMLVASVCRAQPRIHGDGSARSAVALALVIGAICVANSAYSVSGVLLLGAFFLLVASGTSVFGLLTLRGAQRLGHASYSVYLLHGVVLTALFAPSLLGGIAAQSPLRFWLLGALTTLMLVVVAAASFAMIEKPGIAAGQRLLGRKSRSAIAISPAEMPPS